VLFQRVDAVCCCSVLLQCVVAVCCCSVLARMRSLVLGVLVNNYSKINTILLDTQKSMRADAYVC